MVVMVVTMVLMIPVAFMHPPALLIVIVVWMAPVSSPIRRPLPNTRPPDVSAVHIAPVSFRPHIALAWHCRTDFVAERRRSAANVNSNLSNSGRG
jgi:hypothetical protein